MRHTLWLITCLSFALILFSSAAGDQKWSSIEITIKNKAELLTVRSLRLDIVYYGDDFLEVVMPTEQVEILEEYNLEYEVKIEDMTSFYQSRFDPSKMMGGYRTLSEIELVMDSIVNENPTIVKPKYSIGQSLEGREIYVMKISDNPLIDEDEPEMYYFAAIHAREVITPEVLIYYMRYLTDNYGSNPQVTYLVDNREMWFTCVLNPDGYYHNEVTDPGGGGMWRKNRRPNGGGSYGVDLNRNYGYEWGYDDIGSSPYPSEETYRGTGPFSEPESQVARDFIISRNFVMTISYHSYSNLFLWPWGYDYLLTPDNDIFSMMGDTVEAMNSYNPTPAHGLYPANGVTDDWGYGEQTLKNKNYAVTLEVGSSLDGFWPPTSRITPLVQENLEPNLFYARAAGNPEALRLPAPPVIYTIGDVASSSFLLAWHHEDEQNPAFSYDVWQLQEPSRIIDDLENGGANWIEDGFVLSTSRAHSTSHSYYSQANHNSDYKFSSAEPLQVNAGDSLKFWTWYDIESNWDYGYVEISTDGGQNWANIPGNITTTSNPNGNNLGNGITGSSSGWVHAEFDLATYESQEVQVRFRYRSDSYVIEEGWYVDDIEPVDFFTVNEQIGSYVMDTTFLVEDLEIGEYYYRVKARDLQGQLSAYSELAFANVTYGGCGWSIGDADGSEVIDVADVTYLLNYIFTGGSAPTPNLIGSGDSDCSGGVTIGDAVWILAYIFAGGAEPGADCSCHDY